jgi:hypothetical protein
VEAVFVYDSVARPIVSLVFKCFGVPEDAVQSMLVTSEEMKYYLRAAYGDSNRFRGGNIEKIFKACVKAMDQCH